MLCKGCEGELHFECGKYKPSSWASIGQKRRDSWRCGKCKGYGAAGGSQTGIDSDEGEEEQPKVEASVLKALDGFKGIVEELKAENHQSMQFISKQYEDIIGGQKEIKTNLVNMETQINQLTAQLKEKDEIIKNLQTRIADLEQYTRKNNIEIHGVTETRDEDIEDIAILEEPLMSTSIRMILKQRTGSQPKGMMPLDLSLFASNQEKLKT